MSKQGIEIEKILIQKFLSTDAFGLFFKGIDVETGQAILVFALAPFTGRPISYERLKGVLNQTSILESPSIAKGTLVAECTKEQGTELTKLASLGMDQESPKVLPKFLIVYHFDPEANLTKLKQSIDTDQKQKIIHD